MLMTVKHKLVKEVYNAGDCVQQKLVNEVFQTMWFSPVSTRDRDSPRLLQKVMNITDVVSCPSGR